MAQLTTTGLLTLWQLDTTMLPNGQWFYFSSATDFDTRIIWGGNEYSPIPMDASGFEMTSRGAIPTPTMKISNLYGAGNTLLEEYSGLMGAEVIRILTLRRFLDDGATPDPNAYITRDKFVVAQKTSHNAKQIEFKLSSRMDFEGTQLPRRQMLRDICSHAYRIWNPATGAFDYSRATCPYTGNGFWDPHDTPTGPQHDQCSRTFHGCSLRFGGGALPARFFPGIGRVK